MRLNLFKAFAVAGLLAFSPAPARAESIDFTGIGAASVVNLGGLFSGSVYAGELNWSWMGAAPSGFTQSFYSYCVDLLNYVQDPQVVTIGTTSALTGSPHAANGGAAAAWLFNTYASAVHAAGSAVQAAALQVAMWEVLYDSTAILGSGNVILNTTGAIMSQANAYLAALAGSSYQGSSATVLFTSNGQDQITSRVPEPATVMLLGAGLLLALSFRRRSVAHGVQ
ncbi:MAG: PEP-CTERM sorting domain-containing protein [Vicinamibacterales bacterium]